MNILNSVNSNKWKVRHKKTKNNKFIFIGIALGTLISGVVASTIIYTTISTSNNGTSINQITQNNTIDTSILGSNGNTLTNQSNVQIRTNGINGFEYLNVLNPDNSLSGNKLVLTTYVDGTNINYGVGLVDSDYNILSTWAMPVENDTYRWNYTTNIIPGRDNSTFFVLAGIRNITKALNTVYTGYDHTATEFENVVTTDLTSAPSIKIFKLYINNNLITSPTTNAIYDFKYPAFTDQPTYNGGLKFFTKAGNFSSNLVQQDTYAGNATYSSFGYLQYLFYGQLFQYNYSSSTNQDEFALISSYLGSDPGIGNLYGYYNNTINRPSSAFGYYEYFYNEIIVPMIEGDPTTYTTTPYVPKSGVTTTSYKTINQSGVVQEASADDQLTVDAALSIAFMMDYRAATTPRSFDNTSKLSGAMQRIGHSIYNMVPGWFLFKPNISPDWVAYGYAFPRQSYTVANRIWGTAVGTYYDKNNNQYFTLQADAAWVVNNRIFNYKMLNFNYFAIQPNQYGDAGIFQPDGTNILQFNQSPTNSFINKSMFMKVLDVDNSIVAFSTNTNQVGMFINSVGIWILRNFVLFDLSQPIVNFQYEPTLRVFATITNTNIYSFAINGDLLNNYSDENVNNRILDSRLVSISHVSGKRILADNFVYNPDDKGDLNGINIAINGLVTTVSQIYSLQTLRSNNVSTIVDVISPIQVGYQLVKDDADFTANERNIAISTLYTDYSSNQLMALFTRGSRTNGTDFVAQRGFIAPKADFNSISIQEVIVYKGSTMFGFTIKQSDLTESLQNNTYDKWQATYVDVFQDLVLSVVWYLEPSEIINNDVLRNTSVIDMVNLYTNDFNSFQNKYFNLIITRIDNRDDNAIYYLRIVDYNVNTNSITFQTTIVTDQGEIILKSGNSNQENPLNFNYTDVFSISTTDNTIMYLIIGLSVAAGLIIILGLAIGIPIHKNRKLLQNEFKLSNQKIDILTTAIGSVFSKLTKKIDSANKAQQLQSKQPLPIKNFKTLKKANSFPKTPKAPLKPNEFKPIQPIKPTNAQPPIKPSNFKPIQSNTLGDQKPTNNQTVESKNPLQDKLNKPNNSIPSSTTPQKPNFVPVNSKTPQKPIPPTKK